MQTRRFFEGDLVRIDGLTEPGIVIQSDYSSVYGHTERLAVMLSDSENVVVKVNTSGCHLISRSLGSPCQPTPFPDELYQGKGPNLQKFSSENFRELSTLTIDEEIY